MRIFMLLSLAILVLVGTMIHRNVLGSRLLRSDPDAIPANASLRQFALEGGQSTFKARCVSCHGGDGHGDTQHGIPDLTDDDWLYGEGSVSDIERIVLHGIRSNDPKAWNLARMPAFGRDHTGALDGGFPALTPQQINDVIEYLFSLQGRSFDQTAAVRGEQVYKVTGGCYDCHSEDGRGNTAIGAPNLVDRITLYGDGGRQSLFDSIAYGRGGVCPAWDGKLTPLSIRKVAVYVFSLSHAAPESPAR